MRLLLFFLSLTIFPTITLSTELVGRAYDNKTKALLYQETHLFDKNSIRSRYTDADDQLIGKRMVEMAQDRVVRYQLEQTTLGVAETVERLPDMINITATSNGETASTQLNKVDTKGVVIDAGFSNFIVRNWDKLSSGEKLSLDFVSTARRDAIKLQLKRIDSEKSSLPRYGSTDGIIMFNMNIANPFLRLLLKPIEIGYYSDTKQLAYYQGISNLKNANGQQFESMHIKFERQKPQHQAKATASAE